MVTLSPIRALGGGSAAAAWAVGFLRGLDMTPSAYSSESEASYITVESILLSGFGHPSCNARHSGEVELCPLRESLKSAQTSDKSFEDAVAQGVARASKTLRGIKGAWIKEQEVQVKGDKIVGYKVILKITFVLEERSNTGLIFRILCSNDLVPFDLNLLLLDPCTFDPAKLFLDARADTLSNGILEALVRR